MITRRSSSSLFSEYQTDRYQRVPLLHTLTLIFQAAKQEAFQCIKQVPVEGDNIDSRIEAQHRRNKSLADMSRKAGKIKSNRAPNLPASMQQLREYIKLLELQISHERQKHQHLQKLVQLHS